MIENVIQFRMWVEINFIFNFLFQIFRLFLNGLKHLYEPHAVTLLFVVWPQFYYGFGISVNTFIAMKKFNDWYLSDMDMIYVK